MGKNSRALLNDGALPVSFRLAAQP
jgi:hypothetical protein